MYGRFMGWGIGDGCGLVTRGSDWDIDGMFDLCSDYKILKWNDVDYSILYGIVNLQEYIF